jgi:hypothetical protein
MVKEDTKMYYALIENNQVKDIFIEPEGVSIEECFTPEIVPLYIPCPDNIAEGDFYDPETQEFSENPDKKFPNYPEWFNGLRNKQEELSKHSLELTPTINNLPMSFQRLGEYKTSLQFVLTGVDDSVKIDGQQFTGDDFKLMIEALKKFEEDKSAISSSHSTNINSFNNTSDIEAYDFTTGWPETTISI